MTNRQIICDVLRKIADDASSRLKTEEPSCSACSGDGDGNGFNKGGCPNTEKQPLAKLRLGQPYTDRKQGGEWWRKLENMEES